MKVTIPPEPPPEEKKEEKQKSQRPSVPENFKHTDRTLLRQVAFDFVLRFHQMQIRDRYTVVAAADIMREAEELEKWLANP